MTFVTRMDWLRFIESRTEWLRAEIFVVQMMPTQFRSLVPLIQVRSVSQSIAFYQKLGFEIGNSFSPEGQEEPGWAWLDGGQVHLMLGQAEEPAVPSQQGVLFCLYCSDVAAMRTVLVQKGVSAGEITFPFYAPHGEFRIEDPDGYVLMVTHT